MATTISKLIILSTLMAIASIPIMLPFIWLERHRTVLLLLLTLPTLLLFSLSTLRVIVDKTEQGIAKHFFHSLIDWLKQGKRILLLLYILILAWYLLMIAQASASWYYRLFMSAFYFNLMHNLAQLHIRYSAWTIKQKIQLSIYLFIKHLPRQSLSMIAVVLLGILGLKNLILTIFILPALLLWLLHMSQASLYRDVGAFFDD